MELTGKIVAVLDAKSGKSSKTGNPWMMQEYVIEVPGQYPRHCMFSIFGEDKIKQLNIQNGEDLTVQFDIDAREYNVVGIMILEPIMSFEDKYLSCKRKQHQ